MADNDIFRRHVPKPFQSASRAVVINGDVEGGIRAVLLNIDTVRADWTPSVIETVRRIHELACVPSPTLRETYHRLDKVHELSNSRQPAIVMSAAEISLRSIQRGEPVPKGFEEFFALAAAREVCANVVPRPAIARAVVEYNRTWEDISSDAQRFEHKLAGHPAFRTAISEAATSPQTRKRRQVVSLEVLLHTPLSELATGQLNG